MELKIGDRIYSFQYGTINRVEEIERITKALAYTKSGIKFKKLVEENGFCKMVGGDIWSPSFWLETQELKDRLKKDQLSSKLNRLDFSKLSLEKLVEIDKLLNDKSS